MKLLALGLWALQGDDAAGAIIGLGILFLLFILVFAAALYAYVAFCLMKMADKLNVSDSWWAWVPILNLLLLVKMAGKPLWWFLLFFIPLANIVVAVLVLVAVLEALKKPPLLVIGFFVPVVNLVLLGYLAFAD
jgi:hypothetical protein